MLRSQNQAKILNFKIDILAKRLYVSILKFQNNNDNVTIQKEKIEQKL